MDASTGSVLQDVLRRESRSLLMYMADAFPWTSLEGEGRAKALRLLVRDEAEGVNALGRFLVRSGVVPPPLPSYPTNFTTMNFLALDFLLPRLIEAQREGIAALQRDLARIADAKAKQAVEQLLAVKQRNLSALEALQSPVPQAS